MAARNFPSQQASVTWQSNNQQSRGSDGAACWHSLAAPVIKANDGKQQDTISAQQWKIKLCNESTDVICTLSAEGEQERQQKKDRGRGRVISCRSIERWKNVLIAQFWWQGGVLLLLLFRWECMIHQNSFFCFFIIVCLSHCSLLDGVHVRVQTLHFINIWVI